MTKKQEIVQKLSTISVKSVPPIAQKHMYKRAYKFFNRFNTNKLIELEREIINEKI